MGLTERDAYIKANSCKKSLAGDVQLIPRDGPTTLPSQERIQHL
jgi:hypothetical protein